MLFDFLHLHLFKMCPACIIFSVNMDYCHDATINFEQLHCTHCNCKQQPYVQLLSEKRLLLEECEQGAHTDHLQKLNGGLCGQVSVLGGLLRLLACETLAARDKAQQGYFHKPVPAAHETIVVYFLFVLLQRDKKLVLASGAVSGRKLYHCARKT